MTEARDIGSMQRLSKRQYAICRKSRPNQNRRHYSLAYAVPDVEWWDSSAIGWTGSVPVEPAHGLFEQALKENRLHNVAI